SRADPALKFSPAPPILPVETAQHGRHSACRGGGEGVVMDEQAMQQFRAEVMARKNLPTIPTVLARILQLADAENTSGKELIAVVEHDQALTGKMLRLANSAFFGQSRRVATIPRAVVLLGFSTVRSLPPAIVEAVRSHHAADARPGVPGLLAVADRLVAWTDLATGAMETQATALLDKSREHGVTPAVWDDVLRRLREGDELAALTQLVA